MLQTLDGPWVLCCNGYGYWSKLAPLPKDTWWPVTRKGSFYFYPTGLWPKKTPTLPKE